MSQEIKEVTGDTEAAVWPQVEADLLRNEDVYGYSLLISQGDTHVMLVIDIDPGGGFEGGYAFTTLSAPLQSDSDFSFAIHHEGFLDEVGKLFGMQDIETGYAEFDKKVIVKTNEKNNVKKLFAGDDVREAFKTLENYKFHTTWHQEDDKEIRQLELVISDAITDPGLLRRLYHSFFKVMLALEKL